MKKHNCGIYVKPGDVLAISSAVKYLIQNPAIAYEMGQNGRNAVLNEYNWSSEETKLIKLFLDVNISNIN